MVRTALSVNRVSYSLPYTGTRTGTEHGFQLAWEYIYGGVRIPMSHLRVRSRSYGYVQRPIFWIIPAHEDTQTSTSCVVSLQSKANDPITHITRTNSLLAEQEEDTF